MEEQSRQNELLSDWDDQDNWDYDDSREMSTGRSLSFSNLVECELRYAELAGAQMGCVHVSQSCLQGANLRRANLEYAEVENTDMTYANLQDANLQGARLARVDLRWANLKGANLEDCQFTQCNFHGAIVDSDTVLPFDELTALNMGFVYEISAQAAG